MADKENFSPRLPGASAKRASALEVSSSQLPLKKRRVALSYIPSPSNAVPSRPGALKNTISEKKEHVLERQKSSCKDVEISGFVLSTTGTSSQDDEVAMYASDIDQYLRSMEVEPKRRPFPNYMETTQVDVTADMRGLLIDWLVDVAEEYNLVSDTLYLTVSYIDRFLSYNAVKKQRLQLLGATAMLIASKYEDIFPPHVVDVCLLTVGTYSKEEIVEMEKDVLRSLQYEMGNPTTMTFLRRFIKDGQENDQDSNVDLKFMAHYLAELSLMDYGCIKFLPSVVAASAVFLARFTIQPRNYPWSNKLERSTGYRMSELKECIYVLLELQSNKRCSSLRAVKDKYKQHRFNCVSTLLPQEKLLDLFFELKKQSV
ncbi:cyclin-A3-1-like [Carex rostrata]